MAKKVLMVVELVVDEDVAEDEDLLREVVKESLRDQTPVHKAAVFHQHGKPSSTGGWLWDLVKDDFRQMVVDNIEFYVENNDPEEWDDHADIVEWAVRTARDSYLQGFIPNVSYEVETDFEDDDYRQTREAVEAAAEELTRGGD